MMATGPRCACSPTNWVPLPGEDGECHAKAGNLNNALQHTRASSSRSSMPTMRRHAAFLEETLGFFVDEKVAFVQTPQDFYNLDSFQHRMDRDGRGVERADAVLPRDPVRQGPRNSAFFCGSCAVIRRKALETSAASRPGPSPRTSTPRSAAQARLAVGVLRAVAGLRARPRHGDSVPPAAPALGPGGDAGMAAGRNPVRRAASPCRASSISRPCSPISRAGSGRSSTWRRWWC